MHYELRSFPWWEEYRSDWQPNGPRIHRATRNAFCAGTCTGLTDGQLLARFLGGRDQAGEQAFEVLVTRHGPMVLHVCRNTLNDPEDVHNAFQAVFMVLANRAGSIRNRESIASWLYGVAIRVTRERARKRDPSGHP